MRVEVDAAGLAALGLTPADVAGALRGADAKLGAGRMRGEGSDFTVEIAGQFDALSRVRETPLVAGPDGRVLRVGDIATVTRAVAEPPLEIAYAEARRAVLVAARIEDDRQVDRWAADIAAAAEEFRAAAPAGLRIEQIFDRSVYTAERLLEVGTNLAIGVVMLFVSLALALCVTPAMAVAEGVLLSTVVSFSFTPPAFAPQARRTPPRAAGAPRALRAAA